MSAASKPTASGFAVDQISGGYNAASYYRGEAAFRYDEARTMSPFVRRKWAAEETALAAAVAAFEPRRTVLDMPCGTGRFDDLLTRRGFGIIGADISFDMMRAGWRHTSVVPRIQADGTRLPLPDRAVPYALCGRFLNLIPLPVVAEVLTELRRVTERAAIVEVRIRRDRPVDRGVRLGIRWRNRVAGQLGRGSGPTAAMPEREPIKVHAEAELLDVLGRSGWRETDRVEAVYTRMPVRPDPLLFMLLEPR